MAVDLPAFDRPAKAISGALAGGNCSGAAAPVTKTAPTKGCGGLGFVSPDRATLEVRFESATMARLFTAASFVGSCLGGIWLMRCGYVPAMCPFRAAALEEPVQHEAQVAASRRDFDYGAGAILDTRCQRGGRRRQARPRTCQPDRRDDLRRVPWRRRQQRRTGQPQP